LIVIPELLAPSMALALRAAGACPGLDPGAFAFAILQTQSRSDIRTAEAGCRSEHRRSRWPEGQAAGCGALPSAFMLQKLVAEALDSRFRGNDDKTN
jgi:hypothetical protein